MPQPPPRKPAPPPAALPPLSRLLAQLRAHQGDPQRLIALIAPYRPEQLDPIAQDCLDGYLPHWRDLLAWGVAHCAACDVRVSQAFRRAQPDAPRTVCARPIFDTSLILPVGDVHPHALIPSHGNDPDDWIVRPQDAWARVDDYGCCGAAGTPDNTCCGQCGATLGTTHTDCCGVHWTLFYNRSVHLHWGLDPLTPQERQLAARIEAIAQRDPERARDVASTLPADITPQLYADLVHRIGHFGDAMLERDTEGTTAEWRKLWINHGRSEHTSHGGRGRVIQFYRATSEGGYDRFGPSLALHPHTERRTATLTWHHDRTSCGTWPLRGRTVTKALKLLQGPLQRGALARFVRNLPTPDDFQPRALRSSLDAFPWIDPKP